MNTMGGRIVRKPCYGLAEVCERWGVTEQDVASFVAADELTLSIVVAGLTVEKGSIEEVDDRDWFHVPEERCQLSGAADLHQCQAWGVLMNGSETISSFKTEPGRYISIHARGEEDGTIIVSRDRLVVTHAERIRFEAAQDEIAAAAGGPARALTTVAAARGAPTKYDWDEFNCELTVTVQIYGFPESQAALVRRMLDWFAARNQYPDPSTVKKKVALLWRRYHEALARMPA
jgi:hypothetical protein